MSAFAATACGVATEFTILLAQLAAFALIVAAAELVRLTFIEEESCS